MSLRGVCLLVSKQSAVQQCVAELRAKATEFRDVFGDEGRAHALEWAALMVEQALRSESVQLLTLPDASEISCYHPDSLALMVRYCPFPAFCPLGSLSV